MRALCLAESRVECASLKSNMGHLEAAAAAAGLASLIVGPLLAAVVARDDVRVVGPTDPSVRVPTLTLELDRDAGDVAAALGERGVACGSGHFYSQRLTRAMGLDPDRVLRLSFTHTASAEDVDRAVTGLTAVLDDTPPAAPGAGNDDT